MAASVQLLSVIVVLAQCEVCLAHTCATKVEECARQARNAYLVGDFKKAEQLFRAALGTAKQEGMQGEELATLLHRAGQSCAQQGKFGEAQTLLTEALAIRERCLWQEHPDLQASYSALSKILEAQGKMDQAEYFLRKELKCEEQIFGVHSIEAQSSRERLIPIFIQRGDLQAAERFCKDALKMLQSRRAPEYKFGLLYRLGQVYRAQERLALAEQAHLDAIAAWQESRDSSDSPIVMSLNELGSIYAATGRLEEGARAFAEVLKRVEAAHGKDNWICAKTRAQLWRIYLRQGKVRQARDLERGIIATLQQEPMTYASDRAYVLAEMAAFSIESRDFARAAQLIDRFFEVCKRGGRSISPTGICNWLAGLSRASRMAGFPIALDRAGLKILSAVNMYWDQSPSYACEGMNEIVEWIRCRKNLRYARAMVDRLQKVSPEALSSWQCAPTGQTWRALGLLFHDSKDLATAKVCFTRAIPLLKRGRHPDEAAAWSELAVVNQRQGNTSEAQKCRLQAAEIKKQRSHAPRAAL